MNVRQHVKRFQVMYSIIILQENMPVMRERMARELLERRLLYAIFGYNERSQSANFPRSGFPDAVFESKENHFVAVNVRKRQGYYKAQAIGYYSRAKKNINSINEWRDQYQKEIAEKDEEIAEKDEKIAEKVEKIAEKDEKIAEKDKQLLKKMKKMLKKLKTYLDN